MPLFDREVYIQPLFERNTEVKHVAPTVHRESPVFQQEHHVVQVAPTLHRETPHVQTERHDIAQVEPTAKVGKHQVRDV